MFDEVTAQRLGRLEREATRRKWDSVVMTAGQRGQASDSTSPLVPTGERPLVDLVTERFDRLERNNERLEWQIVRHQQLTDLWKRAFAVTLAVIVALSLGSLLFTHGPKVLTAGKLYHSQHPPSRSATGDLQSPARERPVLIGP